jgi:hypothetical protein
VTGLLEARQACRQRSANITQILDGAEKVLRPSTAGTGVQESRPPIRDYFRKRKAMVDDPTGNCAMGTSKEIRI